MKIKIKMSYKFIESRKLESKSSNLDQEIRANKWILLLFIVFSGQVVPSACPRTEGVMFASWARQMGSAVMGIVGAEAPEVLRVALGGSGYGWKSGKGFGGLWWADWWALEIGSRTNKV